MKVKQVNFRLLVDALVLIRSPRLYSRLQLPGNGDGLVCCGYVQYDSGILFKLLAAARYEPFELVEVDGIPAWSISWLSVREDDVNLYFTEDPEVETRLWRKAAKVLRQPPVYKDLDLIRQVGVLDRYRQVNHPDILHIPYDEDPSREVVIRVNEINGYQIRGRVVSDPDFYCELRAGDAVSIEHVHKGKDERIVIRKII